MVLFNYSTRELTAKIVYYGPGLCGKTTNLQYIYGSLPEDVKKGKMLSLATKTDRTLFFDFLPIELGTIRGMKTRIQLYTVPGQVFYNSTRKLVLKGADGVVFVADSQSRMVEANIESYKNLDENLRESRIKIDEIPLVMQFNKRDLPNLSSIEEMNTRINRHNAPFYESVAMTGIGVEDTLKAITKLVLGKLSTKYKLQGADAGRDDPVEQPTVAAAPPPVPVAVTGPAAPDVPEDLALDSLENGIGSTGPEPFTPGATVALPAMPAAPDGAAADGVLDLVEEMPLEGGVAVDDEAIDLGNDLLTELESDPVPVVVHPSAARAARAQPAAPRQTGPPAPRARAAAQPIDLDEPIDLGEALGEARSAAVVSPQEVSIGALAPGETRQVEVPVTVTIDGRKIVLHLKIGVRLQG
jgi:signal recognition particle receptor subunit beta